MICLDVRGCDEMAKARKLDIDYDALRLVYPCETFRESFIAAIREYRAHKVVDFGYPEVEMDEDFAYFLKRCGERRQGIRVPKGFVPNTSFWLTDGVHYLGSGDVRHYLNEGLKKFGGHIGYSIRPQAWGHGLGTIQLKMLLHEARKVGIQTARLTCFDDNVGSYRVMEKNGAVMVNKVLNRVYGRNRLTRIYEIDLA